MTEEVSKQKELREAAQECPACILATVRQTKHEVCWNYDWKTESKMWLEKFGPEFNPEH